MKQKKNTGKKFIKPKKCGKIFDEISVGITLLWLLPSLEFFVQKTKNGVKQKRVKKMLKNPFSYKLYFYTYVFYIIGICR